MLLVTDKDSSDSDTDTEDLESCQISFPYFARK
jgi:hypothetical protein